jgi:hypothetical protein
MHRLQIAQGEKRGQQGEGQRRIVQLALQPLMRQRDDPGVVEGKRIFHRRQRHLHQSLPRRHGLRQFTGRQQREIGHADDPHARIARGGAKGVELLQPCLLPAETGLAGEHPRGGLIQPFRRADKTAGQRQNACERRLVAPLEQHRQLPFHHAHQHQIDGDGHGRIG